MLQITGGVEAGVASGASKKFVYTPLEGPPRGGVFLPMNTPCGVLFCRLTQFKALEISLKKVGRTLSIGATVPVGCELKF